MCNQQSRLLFRLKLNYTLRVLAACVVRVVLFFLCLQKSLKFTTFIHSLVTRYGPQLKAHVPMLRAAAGRCSTFMVKAVLAALKRLDK